MSQASLRMGLRAPAAAAATSRRAPSRIVPRAATAKVSFTLPLHVEFGTEVALVGSSPVLGEWDATSAVPLNWTEGDVWTAEAEVPVGSNVEYKYIIRVPEDGKVLEWQPTPANLVLSIPEAGPVAVTDDWEGAAHEVVVGAAAVAPAPPAEDVVPEAAEVAAEVAAEPEPAVAALAPEPAAEAAPAPAPAAEEVVLAAEAEAAPVAAVAAAAPAVAEAAPAAAAEEAPAAPVFKGKGRRRA